MSPFRAEVAGDNNSRMKQIRVAYFLSSLVAGRHEGRTRRQNRHIGIAQEIFAGSEFNRFNDLRSEWNRCDLLKAVETDVVVPEESRVVGEHLFHAAAAQRNSLAGMVIDL